MRLCVGFKVFETPIDPGDIKRIRGTFGEKPRRCSHARDYAGGAP